MAKIKKKLSEKLTNDHSLYGNSRISTTYVTCGYLGGERFVGIHERVK